MARTFCFAMFLVAIATLAAAQDQKPIIQHTPAKPTSSASGKQMFQAYCASCHGSDAKGDGPAAPALKVPPADLTMLAMNNGGKYPANRVASALSGQADLAAHGNKEMPVWGPIFYAMGGGNQAQVQQRISNLNRYIESLQAK